jgi:EAL domain-containing protein (putative c-di-GMP-specific phosphodiesterase class I)
MDRKLKERMAIESSLRNALTRAQLDVHYQPIIDIQTNRVVGLESLLRWKVPGQGFVPPDKFIAVAEETGLIVPIGDMVLSRACEDMARWRDSGCTPVPIAVNISAVQLQRSNLPATILRLTRQHGIRPSMLQLELTESAVFERRENRSGESNEDAVSKLRELGVRIAIDDFGTGYSSLGQLKRLPFDTLKIDRSFVDGLGRDEQDMAIVHSVVSLAKSLSLSVTAEGIETAVQEAHLRSLGCERGQGYLFARPQPPETISSLLAVVNTPTTRAA